MQRPGPFQPWDGMRHDDPLVNGCPSSGFIMAGLNAPTSVPTEFSTCSDSYLADYYTSGFAGCLGVYCGDGVQQTGEGCDDGNVLDGDCCNSR